MKILINLDFVKEEQLFKFLSSEMGITPVSVNDYEIKSDILSLIPENICRKYTLIPVSKIGKVITVAMADPFNIIALDDLKVICPFPIEPVAAPASEIINQLDRFYRGADKLARAVSLVENDKNIVDESMFSKKSFNLEDSTSPVINLVNLIILNAVTKGASDIHIEPFKNTVRIRYRIDGMLIEEKTVARKLLSHIISRIKIMGDMDIAEKRIPQDGNISLHVEQKRFDLRISSFPVIYGEKIVIRILESDFGLFNFSGLGMGPKEDKIFHNFLKYHHGIVIVTGPTGSGKTTTLYSALNMLNKPSVNICTIEDPVEYHFASINQMQVNHELGINFAAGLRSLMRQDPDIILVGEIRDEETAGTAVQAALTGHLVLTTLHTNNSAGAFHRLLNFNIKPFLINSSVIGVAAQRLLRKLCPLCRKKIRSSGIIKSQQIASALPEYIFDAAGCAKCNNTGYAGRTGIFEILVNTPDIQELITLMKSDREIETAAISAGMHSLFKSGLEKVAAGETSYQELERITYGQTA